MMKYKRVELERLRDILDRLNSYNNAGGAPVTISGDDIDTLKKIIGTVDVFQRDRKNYLAIQEQFQKQSEHPPHLAGVDIAAKIMPYYVIGGDGITYINFSKKFDLNKRQADALEELPFDQRKTKVAEQLDLNKKKVGIFLTDVEGHSDSDAVINRIVHELFVSYTDGELRRFGKITDRLFSNINMQMYASAAVKSTTAIYGEIHINGTFKFMSAGHPFPVVFSYAQNQFVNLTNPDGSPFSSSTPLGMLPSSNHPETGKYQKSKEKFPYLTNQVDLLGLYDVIVMYTDGLSDYCTTDGTPYFPNMLGKTIAINKDKSSKDICDAITKDVMTLNSDRGDDISYVVIKKTA